MRKEIRIKPGYKPPEDVEVYKNRTAEGWKSRGKGGVPGAEGLEAVGKQGFEGESEGLPPHKAAAAKNAKRREARKKAAASSNAEDGATPAAEVLAQNGDSTVQVDGAVEAQPVDPEAEAAKEARKLAKKLRQARELKDKKDKGDGLLPEQFAKVIKIQELIRQLDALGFDAEGERKGGQEDSCEKDAAG